MLKNRL